jgi:cytochrome c oxidase subunit IV
MGMSANTDHNTHHNEEFFHVVPFWLLAAVLTLLLFLTVITVAVTYVDLGPLNIWIAMLIATVKAVFVALFFMHLKYDRPISAVVLIASLLFVALFVGLVLLDVHAYNPDLIPGYAPGITQ